jgi:hypothetical protein
VLGNIATTPNALRQISPSILTSVMNSNSFMEIVQYDLNPSYEMKANLTVERQLPGNMSVSAGFLGNRGIHLWRLVNMNDSPYILVNGRPFVVNGTPRLNQNAGASETRYSDAQAFYNALQVEVKKRFSHGLQFQSSFTWSKNVDDSTTGVAATDYTPGGAGNTSNSYNPKVDRGLSSLHQSRTLVINGIYNLPYTGHSRFTSGVLGGWQVASIFTAVSGTPFSVYVSGRNAPDQDKSTGIQHPDLAPGRSFNSIILGGVNQYFDPTAFVPPPVAPPGFTAGSGFYGNAGRNILIGPGLVNLDFSLHKSIALGIREGSRLEFHADTFNLLNRANFAVPGPAQSQVINPTTRAYIAGAGRITNTVTSSRQIQFGLKLLF